MSKKKVLYITQEMEPYTVISNISKIVNELAPFINGKGIEMRILMPKFGTINERRHRLHEVVRLSGMNIIVDEDDFPLIIKVASLPGARLQVYFLDNEEFFKRKQVFNDENDKVFEDNQQRMVFFCKGAIETVKKFGWPPDIIHCHGWFTALVPMYLKMVYQHDPIFDNAKVLYSAYQDDYSKTFTPEFLTSAAIKDLTEEQLGAFTTPDGINLDLGGFEYSDVIVKAEEDLYGAANARFDEIDKPKHDFSNREEILANHLSLYQDIIKEQEA